ncbi:MAG: adenylate/guanylate cyclase domain-containing protein [Anaerolineae bacterium]|nr:adenylate/guanylate cyclase domain-containing protein [Anaerolineae bacterium]
MYILFVYGFGQALVGLPVFLLSALFISLITQADRRHFFGPACIVVLGLVLLVYIPYHLSSKTMRHFLATIGAGDLPDASLATATWREAVVYPQRVVNWVSIEALVFYAITAAFFTPRFDLALSVVGHAVGIIGSVALTQVAYLFYIEWAMSAMARLALAAGAQPQLTDLKKARLRTKLLLIFLLIVTVPVTVVGFFGYGQAVSMGGDSAHALRLTGAVSILSGSTAALLVAMLIRSVSKSLQEIQRVAEEVSRGNLAVSVRPLAADELSEMGAYFNSMVNELRQQEHLKAAFGRYVSPAVRDGILNGQIVLGGERREITIMFTDIRDFTSWCEETPPETVIQTLNSYYENLIQALIKHGGTVTRYTGDGVLALFGAPLEDPEHALHAVQAAWEAHTLLEKFNAIRRSVDAFELHTGFGIHTGVAVMGSIGSEARAEYTPIGDAANVASRIEGLNRDLHTVILISEATHQRVADRILVGKRAETQVKGRSKPVQVVEVVGLNGNVST